MTTDAGASAAEIAQQWLENFAGQARGGLVTKQEIWDGGLFDSVSLSALRISHCFGGRILCSFRVPRHLADAEGNWHAGAIATLIDNVCCAAIMTDVGHLTISVDYNVSYFSPAKINEEVELDARMIEHKGKLTGVMVEVRLKGSGKMVALGRQWMASPNPIQDRKPRSNL